MNWDQVGGKWQEMKGSVKQRWGRLTDDDLTTIDGKLDVLLGRLQQKYGLTKEQAQQQVNEWKVPEGTESTPKRKAS